MTVVAAFSNAASACCIPKHSFTTIDKGKLTVAVSIYAPYSGLSSAGAVEGVDGDIVKKIAELECLEGKGTSVSGAAAIESVASNRADITIGDWYRTAARAKVGGLSAPIYADQSAIYSKAGLATVGDLLWNHVGSVA